MATCISERENKVYRAGKTAKGNRQNTLGELPITYSELLLLKMNFSGLDFPFTFDMYGTAERHP